MNWSYWERREHICPEGGTFGRLAVPSLPRRRDPKAEPAQRRRLGSDKFTAPPPGRKEERAGRPGAMKGRSAHWDKRPARF